MTLDTQAIVGWTTIIGAIGALGLWLRREIRDIAQDENQKQIHSDAFGNRVAKIVASALTGFTEPIMLALRDLEVRQRDHGRRLGDIEQRVASLEGRTHQSRSGDPS